MLEAKGPRWCLHGCGMCDVLGAVVLKAKGVIRAAEEAVEGRSSVFGCRVCALGGFWSHLELCCALEQLWQSCSVCIRC